MVPTDAGRIVVDGLTKTFGDVTAVDRLAFSVEPGSVTGFLGPNGAGKTTTLRMVVGLVAPDTGQATISGRSYHDLPAPGSEVGAALEASGFHPGRTGRQHLRVYCIINGYPTRRADDVLDMVGLNHAARRAVRGYSMGMRQRLALATALLGDPRVLILDEPANGLDPEGIVWLRRLLRRFADDGRTVLVSSHVLTEMQQMVDRVVIINNGQLVRQGGLSELSDQHGGRVTVQSPDVTRLAPLLTSAGAVVTTQNTEELTVDGLPAARIGRIAHDQQVELHQLVTHRSDLEQLFFDLTTGAAPTEVR